MSSSKNFQPDVFDRAWDQLAAKGRCDARGGAEYVRIRGDWDRLMGLLYAVDFIAQVANQIPPPPPEQTFLGGDWIPLPEVEQLPEIPPEPNEL